MKWWLSHQCDPRACHLADRHYSRKTIGSSSMMPPGRQIVLVSEHADAVWGSSWPYPELLRRAWCPTAWMCTIFRNESAVISSDLIREAVAATRWIWGNPPLDGMVTLVDPRRVKSRNPGYCFKMAGFRLVGFSTKGHLILQLARQDMPEPQAPNGAQLSLWQEAL